MNKVSKFLAPVAMAAAALWAPNASAGLVSSLTDPASGGFTYLGALNSLAYDHSTFNHSTFTTTGSFTDIWVFDFSPIGSAQTNASFTPAADFSSFTVDLWSGTATCPALPAPILPNTYSTTSVSCSPFVPVAHKAAGVTTFSGLLATGSFIQFTGLSAGTYAIYVAGTFKGVPAATSYNGQVTTRPIPEPASLALVGAALMGLALSTRKRKSS